MSETGGERQTDEEVLELDPDTAADAREPRRGHGLVAWVLFGAGLFWLVYFAGFVSSTVGWSLVPQLLPHEIGGLLAGLAAPPAALFGLAALASRRRRLGDNLTDLQIQISRLERPHARAESGLAVLGAQLEQYAGTLEAAIANAREQMQELRGGFGREAAELEQIAEALRTQTASSAGSIEAQAEALAEAAARISANLDQIRGTGQDEAVAIDEASRRAAEIVRELVTSLRSQIESIETGFQDAVTNTVGRVSGAGESAAKDIRTAAEQVVGRTQEVVDAVTRQAGSASVAISDAGSQAAGDIAQASDDALAKARELSDEVEQRALNAGAVYEAAIARANERLAGMAEEAGNHADRLMQELAGRVEQTGAALERVTTAMSGQVAQVSASATQQARDMQTAIEQVAEKSETVAATFRMQERALLEAADEAGRKAEDVRAAYIDANRGVFLHTVNRVLDTLGSLGVELDRTLEGESAPDIIRRFAKGDRGVALRRISARVKDPIALNRVRELYQDDEEFRTLASRYLREFERLLAQAGEADPDELLSASLLTADVGKAYLLLSRAVDRHK